MRVRRASFVQHLQKIMCGGQVTEAVFRDGFATDALTADQLLLVVAPSLPDVEPLSKEIGLADLKTVVASFGFISGEGNEAVDASLTVEDHRLIIDEAIRGRIRLLTASPKTIGTRIERASVEKLLAKSPQGKGIPLTRSLIEGIRNTYSGFKAVEVRLNVAPKGGKVVIGNDNGNMAEFTTKELKTGAKGETYSLLFGEHFVDVLAQITDFSTAEIRLGGAGKPIVIREGDYQYILEPRTTSADDKEEAEGEE